MALDLISFASYDIQTCLSLKCPDTFVAAVSCIESMHAHVIESLDILGLEKSIRRSLSNNHNLLDESWKSWNFIDPKYWSKHHVFKNKTCLYKAFSVFFFLNGNIMVFLWLQRRVVWLKSLIFPPAHYVDNLSSVGPEASVSLRCFSTTGEFIAHPFRWRPSFNALNSAPNKWMACIKTAARAVRSLIRFVVQVERVHSQREQTGD